MYILGTGLLAEELFAVALHAGIRVDAFVENAVPERAGETLCERPVLWVDDFPQGGKCVCALSTTKRTRFIEQVRDRAEFTTLIHPSAVVLPGSTVGAGTILSVGVVVASNTRIGEHVFVNRAARIGHHTRIGDTCTIQPGANIAGAIEIGERAYLGMGAIITERKKIGQQATVAAGAVVIDDVPDRTLVAGVPAKIKKTDVDAP